MSHHNTPLTSSELKVTGKLSLPPRLQPTDSEVMTGDFRLLHPGRMQRSIPWISENIIGLLGLLPWTLRLLWPALRPTDSWLTVSERPDLQPFLGFLYVSNEVHRDKWLPIFLLAVCLCSRAPAQNSGGRRKRVFFLSYVPTLWTHSQVFHKKWRVKGSSSWPCEPLSVKAWNLWSKKTWCPLRNTSRKEMQFLGQVP